MKDDVSLYEERKVLFEKRVERARPFPRSDLSCWGFPEPPASWSRGVVQNHVDALLDWANHSYLPPGLYRSNPNTLLSRAWSSLASKEKALSTHTRAFVEMPSVRALRASDLDPENAPERLSVFCVDLVHRMKSLDTKNHFDKLAEPMNALARRVEVWRERHGFSLPREMPDLPCPGFPRVCCDEELTLRSQAMGLKPREIFFVNIATDRDLLVDGVPYDVHRGNIRGQVDTGARKVLAGAYAGYVALASDLSGRKKDLSGVRFGVHDATQVRQRLMNTLMKIDVPLAKEQDLGKAMAASQEILPLAKCVVSHLPPFHSARQNVVSGAALLDMNRTRLHMVSLPRPVTSSKPRVEALDRA